MSARTRVERFDLKALGLPTASLSALRSTRST
jgi:hypothetical protein